MTNLERLEAEGAYSCGGSLVHRNVELAQLRDGDVFLTDAGKEMLAKLDDVTDVVVKAPSGKKKVVVVVKNPVEQAPQEEDADSAINALDALLGE